MVRGQVGASCHSCLTLDGAAARERAHHILRSWVSVASTGLMRDTRMVWQGVGYDGVPFSWHLGWLPRSVGYRQGLRLPSQWHCVLSVLDACWSSDRTTPKPREMVTSPGLRQAGGGIFGFL